VHYYMKSIYETPSIAIHGKNAYLPLRLDTYISPRRGGHQEACNDTCKGLSSWANRDGRRSRKDDKNRLVSNRGQKVFVSIRRSYSISWLVVSHPFDDVIFCSIRPSIQFGLFGSTISLNIKSEHDLTPSSLSVFT
jgi:hypothetical protein